MNSKSCPVLYALKYFGKMMYYLFIIAIKTSFDPVISWQYQFPFVFVKFIRMWLRKSRTCLYP